jgi:hypothetical protein
MKKIKGVISTGLGRMSLYIAAAAGYLGGLNYLLSMGGFGIEMLSPVVLGFSVLSIVGFFLAWLGLDL